MPPEIFTAEHLAYYVIAANFIAFAVFGIDKALAEAGTRRISEGTLLLWALIGGTPGAYAARHRFRHKTRKQPFSNELHFIAGLQAVVLILGFTVGWDTLGQFIRACSATSGDLARSAQMAFSNPPAFTSSMIFAVS